MTLKLYHDTMNLLGDLRVISSEIHSHPASNTAGIPDPEYVDEVMNQIIDANPDHVGTEYPG